MNEPLLFAALVNLTMHPEKHDQSIYLRRTACGTTMCLAGDVVILTGHAIQWEEAGEAWYTTNGNPISRLAQRELGISRDSSEALFLHCQTINDLWAEASRMTDGRVSKPKGL